MPGGLNIPGGLAGTPYTGYPQPSGVADTRTNLSNPQSILANPQLVSILQQNGVDPYAYTDQLAQGQSDLAYSQHIMEVLQGLVGGGGGGSNPVLDDLARQGVANDRSYLDVLSQLAGKKVGLTEQDYQNQLAQLGIKGAGNQIDKSLLGIQSANTKLDLARLGLKDKDIEDALTKLGLNKESLGLEREGAGNRRDTQDRGIRSDATARGALGARGTGLDLLDNEKQYDLAMRDISNREAGVNVDIGTTARQHEYVQADRQQVENALKGLGFQTDKLNLTDQQIQLAKEALGIQNQGDKLQQYGDLAQLNNQQRALDLKEQGIGVSAGSGGQDAAGTLAALQAGAQANSIAGNLSSLTNSFGRQALAAIGQWGSNQSFGSSSGPLSSLSGGGLAGNAFNPMQNGQFVPSANDYSPFAGGGYSQNFRQTAGGGGKLY